MLFLSNLGFIYTASLNILYLEKKILLGSFKCFYLKKKKTKTKKKTSLDFQHGCQHVYFFPNGKTINSMGLIRCEENRWKCKYILTPPSFSGPPPHLCPTDTVNLSTIFPTGEKKLIT